MALCDELQISLGIFSVSFSKNCYRVEEAKLSKWFELFRISSKTKKRASEQLKQRHNKKQHDHWRQLFSAFTTFFSFTEIEQYCFCHLRCEPRRTYVIMFKRHVCHMRVFFYNAFRLLKVEKGRQTYHAWSGDCFYSRINPRIKISET